MSPFKPDSIEKSREKVDRGGFSLELGISWTGCYALYVARGNVGEVGTGLEMLIRLIY